MDPKLIRHFEAVDFVSTTTIQSVFYGIGFTLYCMCQQMLYRDFRKGDRPKHTMVLFVHSFLIIVVASMTLVIFTQTTLLAYLDHNDSVGGPILYEDGLLPVKPPGAYKFLDVVISPISSFLVTSAEIWRIFIIWSESPYVIHVVAISILSYLACISFFIYSAIGVLSVNNKSALMLQTVSEGLGIAVDLLGFFLIAGRIIFVRRRITQLMSGTLSSPSNQYTSIVAILAESYALSTVVALGATISAAAFDIRAPALSVFSAISAHINMIAYFLVLYRVLSGRAWTPDTERQLTTLRWNHQDTNTTAQVSQIPHNRNVTVSLPPDGSPA
ncbi:hypothetical protein D9756_011503 [Leucocoprinus leucothites]|uniref:Uncharacterized protein n=1 Tax=Leucocoprinus leucothites TaxID=201217 RepID=A0A8H5FQ26_9AGAR|nr:hypothetical protein D9756_011503 [Leucoagaricus leucothites]